MRAILLLAAAGILFGPGLAKAEVADASAAGFTIRLMLSIQASPQDVYNKLVHNVGEWWDGSHTFSGNSHNLSIEEKAGGCFCEKLADGGGVRHLEVVYVAPGKTLVMSGGLGPLQSLATAGSMTITFAPADGGTKLTIAYAVAGYSPAGMNTLAGPVDQVLQLQFTRLKNYVEHGNLK
jgi:uncharacterized protein YndB with AHSA1/START domain